MLSPSPLSFNGLQVLVKDAQEQARTERDVRGPWVRPKVPSKRRGRRGTRRAWKRRNPPHYVMFYREPDDVIVIRNRMAVMTPNQWAAVQAT